MAPKLGRLKLTIDVLQIFSLGHVYKLSFFIYFFRL